MTIGHFLSGPATSVELLTPVAGTPEERLDYFRRAASSFAAGLGRPVPLLAQLGMRITRCCFPDRVVAQQSAPFLAPGSAALSRQKWN
jgi:hypothetical protein